MTIHISAKKDEIAKFVLMPGDPLRAKVMADKFLTDIKLVNVVRGMSMYTGIYKGISVTIAASGMGNGSIGIYSYELFNDYDVEHIIRVGSAGSYKKEYPIYSIFNSLESFGESDFAKIVLGVDQRIIPASKRLFDEIETVAKAMNIKTFSGRVHSSDVFYRGDDSLKLAKENNLEVVEMETFALFTNAKKLNKHAAALFTISDNLVTNEVTSAQERQDKFSEMFLLALETGWKIYHK